MWQALGARTRRPPALPRSPGVDGRAVLGDSGISGGTHRLPFSLVGESGVASHLPLVAPTACFWPPSRPSYGAPASMDACASRTFGVRRCPLLGRADYANLVAVHQGAALKGTARRGSPQSREQVGAAQSGSACGLRSPCLVGRSPTTFRGPPGSPAAGGPRRGLPAVGRHGAKGKGPQQHAEGEPNGGPRHRPRTVEVYHHPICRADPHK